jgi:hypothetical protein
MVINDRLKYQVVYLVIMMIGRETLKELESFTSSKSRMRLEKSKIHRLFTSMRPAYSNAEEEFVQKYMLSPNLLSLGMYQDDYGNCLLKIDNEDGTPSRTLWSCHTDSVHNRGGFQTVHFNPLEDKFSTTDGSCLGGDDNSGTYAMLEMIRNKVPGLYIFHRAEEVGGRGSAWIVENNEEMLKQYDRAIAFDRKDIHSIITHQASRRCCSEAFADDLGEKLGMNHRSDSTGSFTDTANYDHIIPECTNMSVGYFSAHSSRETQLLDYLVKLTDNFIRIDVESLITERNPDAPAEYNMGGYYGYSDNLIKPSREARTNTGWSKQDDLKWKKSKKERKEQKAKKIEMISNKELIDILDDAVIDDDFGPKTTKVDDKKKDEIVEDSKDNPNWQEFFSKLPE